MHLATYQPQLKSANMFDFLFELNIFAQAQFFFCSREKGADQSVKFGLSSCQPIPAKKKLGLILLEYYDHLKVKN